MHQQPGLLIHMTCQPDVYLTIRTYSLRKNDSTIHIAKEQMVLADLLLANIFGERQRTFYSANVTGQKRIFGRYPHPSLSE